jgi:hypothetical protein
MSEQGQAIFEAARQRGGEDPHKLELELQLELARVSKRQLEAMAEDTGPLWQLVRIERRFRRAGEPNGARRALAERLLAIGEPTEEHLREILDAASFGDVPRELSASWLRVHARALALAVLGEATVLLSEGAPVDEALVDEASAWLSAFVRGGGVRPPSPEAGRALQIAMDRWLSAPGDLKSLRQALWSCTDPWILVPLTLSVLSCRDWRLRPRVGRMVCRSRLGRAVLVVKLTDPTDENPLPMLTDEPDTLLACAIWSGLEHAGDRQIDHWEALGRLGEPVALVDHMRPDRAFTPPSFDGLPPHPHVLRALLDILERKDKRLLKLWEKSTPETQDMPLGPYLWRAAISMVAPAARRWDGVPQARRVLWRVLRDQLAHAGEPEDIRNLGLALGMLGDLEALPFVLESLQRQGPRDSVCLALRALGEGARAALPWLEGSDPWTWLTREAIEPHDPQWMHKLAGWLGSPEAGAEIQAVELQYEEGLITVDELRAKLMLQLETLRLLRARGEALPPAALALAERFEPG